MLFLSMWSKDFCITWRKDSPVSHYMMEAPTNLLRWRTQCIRVTPVRCTCIARAPHLLYHKYVNTWRIILHVYTYTRPPIKSVWPWSSSEARAARCAHATVYSCGAMATEWKKPPWESRVSHRRDTRRRDGSWGFQREQASTLSYHTYRVHRLCGALRLQHVFPMLVGFCMHKKLHTLAGCTLLVYIFCAEQCWMLKVMSHVIVISFVIIITRRIRFDQYRESHLDRKCPLWSRHTLSMYIVSK